MKTYDQFGNPLKVGDPIIYSRKNDYILHEGIVAEIINEHNIKVRNKDTGRVSVNPRASLSVINVKPLMQSNPEWFI